MGFTPGQIDLLRVSSWVESGGWFDVPLLLRSAPLSVSPLLVLALFRWSPELLVLCVLLVLPLVKLGSSAECGQRCIGPVQLSGAYFMQDTSCQHLVLILLTPLVPPFVRPVVKECWAGNEC